MTDFTDLGVPRRISDALAKRGITAAFPIQALTIADAMAGRDLCGRAPAGSGKTLAFGIPLAALARKGEPHRPSALVLVPTRELAAQVAEAVRPLAQARDLKTAAFYGGTSITKDRQRLERGVDIAIACPGRLADLVQRGFADLRDVRLAVLDEADRMADMGFLPEVRRLLDRTHGERQVLLFSATLDGDVDVLITRYQRDPARHELAQTPEAKGDVQHFFWTTPAQERVALTADIVQNVTTAIVFTRTKRAADRVAKQLGRRGVAAAAIHGDRSQKQRERALGDFVARRVTTLVATDVAARGIHVDAVGVVVHYDPAGTDKDYLHRSGRTGRVGANGLVVTLVAPDKARDVRALQRALGMRREIEPVRLEAVTGGRQAPLATAPAAVGTPAASAGARSRPDRRAKAISNPATKGRGGSKTNAAKSQERGRRHRTARHSNLA
ncbi:MAG: DEAD/DEAH box helicase [Actinomycetota bacterium]|nr:DEAD/DEAH box helicase [Actinomycetota bacterium]